MALGDTQGFTLSGVDPETVIIYDTVYSDGRSDYVDEYGTDEGRGVSDREGTFSTTWVIDPTVPLGRATLHAAGVQNRDQLAQAKTTFVVVDDAGHCP